MNKLSLKPYLLDDFYHSIYSLILVHLLKHPENQRLIDPDPSLFTHEEVKTASNVTLYQYFLICAQL
ncbi:MAG TPA: hypothetical protein ENG10_02925 [Candidatus Bathyarchaeota archaeon]|nr:hypothetical protein [Candidatus Bathyarchaeota archaeon]HEX69229.1 hypothetical protein [Candidatus Bathyarchaeota archaeon]